MSGGAEPDVDVLREWCRERDRARAGEAAEFGRLVFCGRPADAATAATPPAEPPVDPIRELLNQGGAEQPAPDGAEQESL